MLAYTRGVTKARAFFFLSLSRALRRRKRAPRTSALSVVSISRLSSSPVSIARPRVIVRSPSRLPPSLDRSPRETETRIEFESRAHSSRAANQSIQSTPTWVIGLVPTIGRLDTSRRASDGGHGARERE